MIPTIWKELDKFEDVFFANFKSIHEIMKPWLPYNYYKDGKTGNLILEVAVAGYGKDSLVVETKKGHLRISGKISDKKESSFVHKGIALRNFDYTFPVQLTYEVGSAELKNGMLRIILVKTKEIIYDSVEIKEIK